MNDDEAFFPQFRDLLKGMIRRNDYDTSRDAAHGIVIRNKSKLQRKVLEAFAKYGPMTDMELEEKPEFRHYAQTTVSKRRTELYQAGYLVMCDFERRNKNGCSMKVWKLASE